MKYQEIIKLLDEKFKRYTGIKKKTFELIVELIKEDEKNNKKKIGGPPKLCIEDQVLAALAYWREYRTQDHLAVDYGVGQQTIGRYIIKIENILHASGKFVLCELKDEEVIIVDVMESPIERPKKNKNNTTAERRKNIHKKQNCE